MLESREHEWEHTRLSLPTASGLPTPEVKNMLMEMASTWLHCLTLLSGSAIIFFLCSQLFSILLEEQADIQPNILNNYPHVRHPDDTGQNHLEGQKTLSADASYHKYGNTVHWTWNLLSGENSLQGYDRTSESTTNGQIYENYKDPLL